MFFRGRRGKTWKEYREQAKYEAPDLFTLKDKVMPLATQTVNLNGDSIVLKELLNEIFNNLEFRIASSNKLLDVIKKLYESSWSDRESKDEIHFSLHSYVLYLKTALDCLALLTNYLLSLNLVRKRRQGWWYPDFDCADFYQALTSSHPDLAQFVDAVKQSGWYIDLTKFRNASAHTDILEHNIVAFAGSGVGKVKLPDDPNAPPTLRGSSRTESLVDRCEPWHNETVKAINSFCQILCAKVT